MHKPGSRFLLSTRYLIYLHTPKIAKCLTDVAGISVCFDDSKAVSILNAIEFTINIDLWLNSL